MASRIQLQEELEKLLDSKNVYYQPPESVKMEFPAIVYSRNDIETNYAGNSTYILTNRYRIIVIDRKPDNPVISKILQLPMCSFESHYASNNLHHDVLSLYY